MTTSAISGKTGSITTASGATEVTNIDVEEVIEILEATSMASGGDREYIEGLAGVSFTLTGVGTKPSKGADASLTINSGANTWQAAAIIGNVRVTAPVEGVVGWEGTGNFTGSVTIS